MALTRAKILKNWRKRAGKKHMSDLQIKYNRKRRKEAITQYGGMCACCGESRFEFLAFDHKAGGGGKHREKVGWGDSFVRWLMRNNFPKSIQLLCHSCNLAKGFYGKCPHETENLDIQALVGGC